jgi:hypothetical protein
VDPHIREVHRLFDVDRVALRHPRGAGHVPHEAYLAVAGERAVAGLVHADTQAVALDDVRHEEVLHAVAEVHAVCTFVTTILVMARRQAQAE